MLAINDLRHGTTNGYTNQGCRCGRCRDAHSIAHQGYVLRLKQSGRCRNCTRPIGISHSTVFCGKCRARVTQAQRTLTRSRVGRCPLIATDARHGTLNGYSYWGCRCEACKAIASDYCRQWLENKRPIGILKSD